MSLMSDIQMLTCVGTWLQMIRSVGSLLLTMPFVKADSWRAYLGTKSLWPLLALRGFTGAASMTFYYESIDRMPLADAVSTPFQSITRPPLFDRGMMIELLSCHVLHAFLRHLDLICFALTQCPAPHPKPGLHVIISKNRYAPFRHVRYLNRRS